MRRGTSPNERFIPWLAVAMAVPSMVLLWDDARQDWWVWAVLFLVFSSIWLLLGQIERRDRRLKALEKEANASVAQIHRIKEIMDDAIWACREAAYHSSQAHDGGVSMHENEGDLLERLFKRMFPSEER